MLPTRLRYRTDCYTFVPSRPMRGRGALADSRKSRKTASAIWCQPCVGVRLALPPDPVPPLDGNSPDFRLREHQVPLQRILDGGTHCPYRGATLAVGREVHAGICHLERASRNLKHTAKGTRRRQIFVRMNAGFSRWSAAIEAPLSQSGMDRAPLWFVLVFRNVFGPMERA